MWSFLPLHSSAREPNYSFFATAVAFVRFNSFALQRTRDDKIKQEPDALPGRRCNLRHTHTIATSPLQDSTPTSKTRARLSSTNARRADRDTGFHRRFFENTHNTNKSGQRGHVPYQQGQEATTTIARLVNIQSNFTKRAE